MRDQAQIKQLGVFGVVIVNLRLHPGVCQVVDVVAFVYVAWLAVQGLLRAYTEMTLGVDPVGSMLSVAAETVPLIVVPDRLNPTSM